MDKFSHGTANASLLPHCCLSHTDQTSLPDDDTPLTRDILEAFLKKDGADVGKCFMRWADKHGISRHDARDAIGTVLTTLICRISEGVATMRHLSRPMLFASAMRQAVKNHKRSKAVMPPVLKQAQYVPRRHDPEEVYKAMKAAIPTALERLELKDWVLLILCDAEDGTQDDAAAWFGVVQGSISRWLDDARRRLQREIIADLLRQGFYRSELPVIPL